MPGTAVNVRYVAKFVMNNTTGLRIVKYVPNVEGPEQTNTTGQRIVKNALFVAKPERNNTTGQRIVISVPNVE